MRIVLDTNVLIAAFIAHGNCNELLEHCVVHHAVVLSPFILDELQSVLTRKFGYGQSEARMALRLLQTRTEQVNPPSLSQPICRDPDDDAILALAQFARCQVIIAGDKDLTDLKQFEKIKILTPADFWKFENDRRA